MIERVSASADVALDGSEHRSVIVLGNHSDMAPVEFLRFLRPEIADKIASFGNKFLARCVDNAVRALQAPLNKAVVVLLS